ADYAAQATGLQAAAAERARQAQRLPAELWPVAFGPAAVNVGLVAVDALPIKDSF
ncbi:MAG: hypothetical protein HY902_00645, partial [Deltaproteobacteria bacterium]|nr:hypothetical protein [Deltaproteobacteria bacterium]